MASSMTLIPQVEYLWQVLSFAFLISVMGEECLIRT